MAPNTGTGQDFKEADEQKGAQANELHWFQLSHFAHYLGLSGPPRNTGQHQQTTSWNGLELTGEIHWCRHLGPAPMSGHIHLAALPPVLFPWRQWVLLDLALTSQSLKIKYYVKNLKSHLFLESKHHSTHPLSAWRSMLYPQQTAPQPVPAIHSQCWSSLKLWSWLQLLCIICSTKRGSSVALLPQHGRAALALGNKATSGVKLPCLLTSC